MPVNVDTRCPIAISEIVSLGYSEKQAEELIDYVESAINKMVDRGETASTGNLSNLKQQLMTNAKQTRALNMRNATINHKKRMEFHEFANNFKDGHEAVKAFLVGHNKVRVGSRYSVDAHQKMLEEKHLGGLVNDLEKADLYDVAKSKQLDREIAIELAEMRKTNGKPGVTKNKIAKDIATIYNKWQTVLKNRANRAGAFIDDLEGYVVKQTHNRRAVKNESPTQWKQDILPKLDVERTFGDMTEAEIDDYLTIAYNHITTGKHEGFSSDNLGLYGTRNIGSKLSAVRKLHFKSADDWFTYDQKYGNGDLFKSMGESISRMSKDIGLMEKLGPNPEQTLSKIIDDLLIKHGEDSKISNKLQGEMVRNWYKELSGETNIAVGDFWPRLGANIRVIQNMSKLGGATLSAIADVPLFASEMSYQGVSLLKAYSSALTNFLRGRRTGDQREIARLIGVGLDAERGAVLSRFTAADGKLGMMTRLQQSFFKVSGLTYWTDAQKVGAVLMLSTHLAKNAERSFDKINVRLRRGLEQYGINEESWEIYRKAIKKADDGNYYMTPEAIMDLDDKYFKGFDKEELADRLRTYYSDRADYAVITPGAGEQAIMRQGKQPGTPIGEAIRFVAQFKSFSVTIGTKVMGRTGSLRGGELAGGAVHLILGTTVFGYLAQSAKDIAKGRKPRDFTESPHKVWASAMAQGGGLGIYGDFLFNAYSRYGQGVLKTMAGPTANSLEDTINILRPIFNLAQGEVGSASRAWQKTGDNIFRLVKNHTPFLNLWYTRTALDYLLLYRIQEEMNPGYLRRYERAIKKWNDQEFIVPPSKVIR